MLNGLWMILLLELPFVLVGLLSAFMPYMTRKTECFGVTVPASAQEDPQVADFKRAYRNTMLVVSLVLIAITTFVLVRYGMENGETGAWFFTGGIFALLILDFALYLKYHYALKRLKAERGWAKQASQVAVVSITDRRDVISPLWLLTFFAWIAVTVAVGIALYDKLPDRIPTHYDFAGNVTDTMQKSIGTMLFAPGIQLFMALVLAISYWAIAKARRQIDAENPEQSLEQSRRFRIAWSAYVIALGNLLMAMFMMMELNFVGIIPASALGWVTGVPIVLILVGTMYLTVRYGQGGSRVRIGGGTKATVIDRDDDSHWKIGQFYVNKDDPSLFVEKRFGVGFTLNFAHPAAWLFMGGILALIVVSVVLSLTGNQ